MEFENIIGIIEAEIDSLTDAYKAETIQDRKTVYSSRILECKKAIKILSESSYSQAVP
jgi:hypothetical protein